MSPPNPQKCPWWGEVERAYSGVTGGTDRVLYTDENVCNSRFRTHARNSWNKLQQRLESKKYEQSKSCSELGEKIGKKMRACPYKYMPAERCWQVLQRAKVREEQIDDSVRAECAHWVPGWEEQRKRLWAKGHKSQSQSQPQSPNGKGNVRASGHPHESPPVTRSTRSRGSRATNPNQPTDPKLTKDSHWIQFGQSLIHW